MFNARWSGKRNKLFGFHCTATRPIATRPAGVRPARPGKAMAAALAWLTAAAVLAVFAAAAQAQPSRTWREMFDLQPGVTYTYTLTYESDSRGGRPPWLWVTPDGWSWDGWSWEGPGRGGQRVITGQLNLYRTGGGRDEVRFWFVFGDVRVNGSAPVDPQAVAGAVLVAALTGPDPLPGEAVRLLATAFHWTLWRDLFAQATFRDGFVWESLQNPAYRFTARQRGFALYEGEVTRGRDVVLELTIDLTKPLPLEIVAYDGRDRYEAVLVSSPVAGPRR